MPTKEFFHQVHACRNKRFLHVNTFSNERRGHLKVYLRQPLFHLFKDKRIGEDKKLISGIICPTCQLDLLVWNREIIMIVSLK